MDEKMIEWIALEEAGEHGLETDAALIDFAHRFLARINSVFGTFQQRVHLWMVECFGTKIAADRQERNHRFLEESLELVQSLGCTASEAHQLVDYVFGRPVGEASQETGGVMVTLAALGLANDLDMRACGEAELARVWTKVEQIRAKQAAKPKHSPLPEHVTATPEGMTLVSAEPVAWGVLEWEIGEPNPEQHAWSFIAGWNELAQEHIKDLIQAQIDSGDRPMKYKTYPLAMIVTAKEPKC